MSGCRAHPPGFSRGEGVNDRAARRRDADLDCVDSRRGRAAYDQMLRAVFADVPGGRPLPVEVDAALARLKARVDAEPDGDGLWALDVDLPHTPDPDEGWPAPDVQSPCRLSTPAVAQVARFTAARALWRAGAALLELGARIDPAVEAGR